MVECEHNVASVCVDIRAAGLERAEAGECCMPPAEERIADLTQILVRGKKYGGYRHKMWKQTPEIRL